ncbi:unnamed protein product [Bursaphelenchus okinawaensis]|uniref:Chromo domain-containing protein n=1 Tax=Bursaphelenchus okinawaensis TaxID=465554 RepID=A0A811KN37_9BILA|nr:unnamed protein product [Bursaphelenchus okinawaensis]CAG9108095.1 unnamed protein product [Bursaphelenchus okinawaensis]
MAASTKVLYEVERILAHVVENGETLYHIKWKNCKKSESTWEPEESLKRCGGLLTKYKASVARTKCRKRLQKTAKVSKKDQNAKQSIASRCNKVLEDMEKVHVAVLTMLGESQLVVKNENKENIDIKIESLTTQSEATPTLSQHLKKSEEYMKEKEYGSK